MDIKKLIGWIFLVAGGLLFLWNMMLVIRPMYAGYQTPLLVGDVYLIISIILIVIGALIIWFSRKK